MKTTVHTLKANHRVNPLGLDRAPGFSWKISSPRRDTRQKAYEVHCAIKEEELVEGKKLAWSSGVVESDQSQFVLYEGREPGSSESFYWRVRIMDEQENWSDWSEIASWEMGLLHASDWKAKWISPDFEEKGVGPAPCPYLRQEIVLEKEVFKVRAYITAKGLYEFSVNGHKVGDQHFTPGWTTYDKHLQYQVYDLGAFLNLGRNALGIILGDGWYRGYLGWQGKRAFYGGSIAALCQLELEYADGSCETICSDESWKSARGPILSSDIYMGESYDARLKMEGWNTAAFDYSGWTAVRVIKAPFDILQATSAVPVKEIESIHPVSKFRTPRGELVYDLGVNIVGRVRFRLKGEKGSRIVLHHAEVLDPEGNFYTDNLRAAKAEDVYVFKGEGVESYEPRFTFHGFRYIRISEYEGEPALNELEGVVISSDTAPAGDFKCSDPLVNQLQQNILRGLRGNFLDVPTDCPQRDERMGWTGDAQVFASTANFNVDTYDFYRKWLKDLALEQREDGSVPWVVPNAVVDGGGTGWSDGFGATGWADAAVIMPWELYLSYGDKRILEDQYESMKNWVDYMIREAGESLIFKSGFHFGDWLSFAEYHSYNYNAPDYGYAGAYTSKELIATAYFSWSTAIFSKVAAILGKKSDAESYGKLVPGIKKAYQDEFITRTGRLVSETQTAYVLSLAFDLLPGEHRSVIAQRLADDVNYFGHLTTGFLGTPLICSALSENGFPGVAMKLLMNKRYPSWLYPITKGATTIWERWDGIKPDGSFQDVGMNSFNHYAYGAVGNWMYTYLAGIRIDEKQPGYKHFILQPAFPPDFDYLEGGHTSNYGDIRSAWKRAGEELSYSCEIPANTSALLKLPLTEGDEWSLQDGETREDLRNHGKVKWSDTMECELGSGKYVIRFKEKR